MELPGLEPENRSREFLKYDADKRVEAVVAWIIDGMSTRKIDREILKFVPGPEGHRGFESMNILHHLGLRAVHQGMFEGMSLESALEEMRRNPQYADICRLLEGKEIKQKKEIIIQEYLGLERETLAKARVNQDAFRESVLTVYGNACCVTGMASPSLLRASHIKPWCVSTPRERTDVRNGLCLNALHDAAFDRGLMTLDPDSLRVVFSNEIQESMEEYVYDKHFRDYEGKRILTPNPEKSPGEEYLQYHRRNIFEKGSTYLVLRCELLIDEDHSAGY